MPMISEQLPNLMNGVSQQAVSMRMASQGEAQVNGLSSIVDGNTKRPPFRHVAKLPLPVGGERLVHTINRDLDERYVLVFDGNAVRAFDLDGVEIAVTVTDGTEYLQTATPKASIRVLTVADYTFIVNREVEVETLPDRTPYAPNEAVGFVSGGAPVCNYKVYVDGAVVASKSEDTDGYWQVSASVAALASQAQTNLGSGWTVTASGPIIHIEKNDGTDFTFDIVDNKGNVYTQPVKGTIQKFTDLPVECKNGFTVEVAGDDGTDFDNYYVKFETNSGDEFGRGVWKETVAPDIEHKLNPATMPHVLVRLEDGTFELRQAEWDAREAGDLVSAPWPSFVGGKINYVYLDRRRLCFLSGSSVVMSRARKLFSFFPETGMTLLDDNPIDISAPGTSVADLVSSQSFDRRVIFFSEQKQFVIDDDYLLATQPPALKEVSAYEAQQVALPATAGRMVYLPTQQGNWAGVLEYYTMSDMDTTDASDVTEHVPRYVPAPITSMAASGTRQMLLLLSAAAPNRLYVYKYHWRGNEKLQSSWSYWELDAAASILSASFVNDLAYFVVEYPDAIYLMEMQLGAGGIDGSEEFVYCLDRRITEAEALSISYDVATALTTVEVPYRAYADLMVATRTGDGTSDRPHGTAPTVVGSSINANGNTVLSVAGDLTATQFFIGQTYEHRYTFSEPVLLTSSGSGGAASVVAGRLQVAKWHVFYSNTGYMRFEVLRDGAEEPYVYHVSAVTLGGAEARLGEIGLASGRAGAAVRSRSDQVTVSVVNDSFTPSSFTAAEWEGRFTRKTSRV